MISLELWGRRPIAAANGASLLSGMVMIGLTTFLPVFVQGVMGDSPLIAGFAFSAMVLGWPVGATFGVRLLQALRRPRRAAHGGPARPGRRAGVPRPDRGDFADRRRAWIARRRARHGPSVERLDHPHPGDRRLVRARQRHRRRFCSRAASAAPSGRRCSARCSISASCGPAPLRVVGRDSAAARARFGERRHGASMRRSNSRFT